jgi:hypothetical protein
MGNCLESQENLKRVEIWKHGYENGKSGNFMLYIPHYVSKDDKVHYWSGYFLGCSNREHKSIPLPQTLQDIKNLHSTHDKKMSKCYKIAGISYPPSYPCELLD